MASTKKNKYGVTDQQQRFADEYIINPSNATQAAVKAGYSPNTASATASRLLSYVNVQNYLKERKKEIDDSKIADQKEILEFWSAGMRGDRKEDVVVSTPIGVEQIENPLSEKDRIKNAELLAKATGMFVERQEVTNTQPIVIASAPLSEDEKIEVNDDDGTENANS